MRNLKKVLIILIMMLGILSVKSLATTATINVDATRLREENNTTSEILTKIYKNEEVEIVEEQGEWLKVKYKKYTGYIKKEFVNIKEESTEEIEHTEKKDENKISTYETETSETNKNTNSVTVLVTTHLRILPNFMSKQIDEIREGTSVSVISKMNKWMQVTDGVVTGWILNTKVNIQSDTSQAESSNIVVSNISDKKNKTENNTINTDDTVTNNTVTNSVENKDLENKILENKTEENQTTNNEVAQSQSKTVSKKGVINVETAKVRKEPSTKADLVALLDKGDVLTISEEIDDWYRIEHGEIKGYVSAQLITITKDNDAVSSRSLSEERKTEEANKDITAQEKKEEVISATGNQVVEYAKQYLNYPYVTGGKTPESGFDCSGFTRYIYKNFGYQLASVAASQVNVGEEVSRDELQPGDLVLFYNDGKTKIGHTGIYVGNGDFIHAANSKRGVVYDNINTVSYYNERYVTARRIVK